MPLSHFTRSLFSSPSGALITLRLWLNGAQSKQRHVFIVGVPRAGTTLLKSILVAHSEMCGTDYETTGVLYTVRNEVLRPIEGLPDWRKLELLRTSSSIAEYYDAVVAELRRPECLQFVDKASPRQWLLRKCVERFPNSLFIAPIRDPRDTWCSARRHGHVYEANGNIRRYVKHWNNLVAGFLQLKQKHSNFLLTRYEDLAADPEGECRVLMRHVGLEFEPRQVSVEAYSSATTLRSTTNHQNLTKPISTESVGRWRNEITNQEFQALRPCWETMRRCGYDPVG